MIAPRHVAGSHVAGSHVAGSHVAGSHVAGSGQRAPVLVDRAHARGGGEEGAAGSTDASAPLPPHAPLRLAVPLPPPRLP
eukprot:2836836-Rhodomonas_salina.1